MTRVYNRIGEKEKRRELRRSMPSPEVLLWSRLNRRQLVGVKFRRQHSIGPFVVDFYCPAAKVAIELDGETHFRDGAVEYDAERQAYIERFGIRVLRFGNRDVFSNLDGVLSDIIRALTEAGVVEDPEKTPPSSPPW